MSKTTLWTAVEFIAQTHSVYVQYTYVNLTGRKARLLQLTNIVIT